MGIKNMKVGQGLALVFGAVGALLLALSLFGADRLEPSPGGTTLSSGEHYTMALLARQIIHEIHTQSRSMRNVALTTDTQEVMDELARVKDSSRLAGLACERLEQLVRAEKNEEFVAALAGFRERYLSLKAQFVAMVLHGQKDQAAAFLLNQVRAHETAYTGALEQFLQFQGGATAQGGHPPLRPDEGAPRWILLLAPCGAILSVLAGLLMARASASAGATARNRTA